MAHITRRRRRKRSTRDRLAPRGGELYVVRWVRSTRGDVGHRYYRRGHDARRFAIRLGCECAIYAIAVDRDDWIEIEP